MYGSVRGAVAERLFRGQHQPVGIRDRSHVGAEGDEHEGCLPATGLATLGRWGGAGGLS